jgi:hypothetical protein
VGDGANPAATTCQVSYDPDKEKDGRFRVEIEIRNTGRSTIRDWTLVFDFLGDQRVLRSSHAEFSQDGSQVTLEGRGSNATIRSGREVEIYLLASGGELTNPSPGLFRLNGQPCSNG